MIKLPQRYGKIIKTFTAGGMSDTFLCYDAHLQREVVIKKLKSDLDYSKLVDELVALSSIRSKYVVEILDVISENGKLVGLVEEYLPGAGLIPLVGGSSNLDIIKSLYPIAAGVAAIHAHGRVHRDLKPDNMRYDSEGQLKIFDFGLAKDANNPGTTVLYFSDGFTAPECFIRSDAGLHTFDFSSDVFAFGCIAIWLLNGGTILPELKGLSPQISPTFSFTNLSRFIDKNTNDLLLSCLNADASLRPTIFDVCTYLGNEILRNRHRMMLTFKGKQYVADASRTSVTMTVFANSISVLYDGIGFTISAVSGLVSINNLPAQVGQKVTGSTVIVLGSGVGKASVTCDVSHPEVML